MYHNKCNLVHTCDPDYTQIEGDQCGLDIYESRRSHRRRRSRYPKTSWKTPLHRPCFVDANLLNDLVMERSVTGIYVEFDIDRFHVEAATPLGGYLLNENSVQQNRDRRNYGFTRYSVVFQSTV